MVRSILASFVLLTASAGLALGTGAEQAVAPCACCQVCACEDCACDELGCACDTGGECFCEEACHGACCAE